MDNQQQKELIDKYLAGNCNEQERETIESWYLSHAKTVQNEKEQLDETDLAAQKDQVWRAIEQQINPPAKFLWPRLIIAASIFLSVGVGTYLAINRQNHNQAQQISRNQKNDLAPGGNKAILTLGNGAQISLTNAKNGILASQGNIRINKTRDGSVRYDFAKAGNNAGEAEYNTVSTPKGGKYVIMLADGTTATLDALSSIRFPTAFNGNTRVVSTTGQVYFEVAHNAAKPFKVITPGQTVEVLGTHFNIDAYNDEPAIKTTLLEGSIKLSRGSESVILKPGEQSQVKLADNKIDVTKDIDMEEAVAWKNGFFQFNNADIKSVMKQLARWYDVDVQYEGKIPERSFSGKIYKNVNASQILKILSLSKVKFKIEGNKIIVTE